LLETTAKIAIVPHYIGLWQTGRKTPIRAALPLKLVKRKLTFAA
jgi:hypothetical protein